MKKLLSYAAAFTVATTALISLGYASARADDGGITHIDGNVQFPPSRWRLVRHTFRLHVPQNSKAVTQLLIKVPHTVSVSNDINNIDVVDKNNQKINTNVFVKNRTILLTFPELLAPNTKFNIALKNVKIQRTHGNGYIYGFSAKVVGNNAEIPVGVAWFRNYL